MVGPLYPLMEAGGREVATFLPTREAAVVGKYEGILIPETEPITPG